MTSFLKSTVAAAVMAFGVAGAAHAGPVNPLADVVFIVDESGSMSGEHAWLGSLLSGPSGLDAKLATAGVSDRKYWLVGFGSSSGTDGRFIGACGAAGCDVGTFGTATSSLVTSGGSEDGYAGMNFALANALLRAGSARNFILVTDEDRDDRIAGTTRPVDFENTRAALSAAGVVLNVVVNATFGKPGFTAPVIGIDDTGAGYSADGSGGYVPQPATFDVVSDAGTTEEDYVEMMRLLNGAAWNLNILRAGGLSAASFTAAFTDIKVQEIISTPGDTPVPGDTTVPAPASLALLGAALAGLGLARRRR